MRTTITAQQMAYFTQNGYIEFEGIASEIEELFAAVKKQLASRLHTKDLAGKTPAELYAAGRDLWRQEQILQTLIVRKLAPIAFVLSAKSPLRLACDQWIPAGNSLKPSPCKDLFSIQGLVLGALLSTQVPTKRPSPLGVFPLPSKPGNVLFFKPTLILDWPKAAEADLYLAAFALPNAVYVQNVKDPSTNALKTFGYGFGDHLRTDTHPLIQK